MDKCLQCGSELVATKVSCRSCGLSYSGEFGLPRLARMSPEHQRLIEQFILCDGNFKQFAQQLGLSHPTSRKRFTELQLALKQIRASDAHQIDQWLDEVESGKRKAEEVARLIEDMNGSPDEQ